MRSARRWIGRPASHRRPLDAKAFYGAIAAATLVGVAINFVDLDPIKALFWSAVINGVVAVPLMVVIMLMAMQRRVMGAFTLPSLLWVIGWLSTAAMAVAVAAMFRDLVTRYLRLLRCHCEERLRDEAISSGRALSGPRSLRSRSQ